MLEIVHAIAEYAPWMVVALLTLNLSQRRHLEHGERKRFATLYLSVLVLVLFASSHLILLYGLPTATLGVVVLLIVGIAGVFHEQVLPFRFRCGSCGTNLTPKRVLYYDSNQCRDCDQGTHDA